uniref:Uncharacterized protein n=1 Tax=Terrapene triunguis TaxID=2587831 RepID=A0A674K9B0_9SAUR
RGGGAAEAVPTAGTDRAGRSSRPGTSPARQAPDTPPERGAGLCAHRAAAPSTPGTRTAAAAAPSPERSVPAAGERRPRGAAAADMGERPRAQPGAPPAAAAPSGSLLNGLLHNGFHPPPPPLLRQEPPVPGHGSPAKKCRLRRRLDSGRRNRPRKCCMRQGFSKASCRGGGMPILPPFASLVSVLRSSAV